MIDTCRCSLMFKIFSRFKIFSAFSCTLQAGRLRSGEDKGQDLSSVPGLGALHPLHFLLKLKEPVHERFSGGGAAGHVDVNRDNSVTAPDNSIRIMIIAWRGEARKTIPYLSMSYLGAAMCIISTAQQASPKVRGHREPFLPQLTRSSTLARAHSTLFCLKSTLKGE